LIDCLSGVGGDDDGDGDDGGDDGGDDDSIQLHDVNDGANTNRDVGHFKIIQVIMTIW